MPDQSVFDILAAHVVDPATQWSMGSFGAIAEFSRDADEAAQHDVAPASLSVVTARGGLRLVPHPALRLLAFETTTQSGWNHRAALCLPVDAGTLSQRSVLTELGADTGALRAQDRDAILFDLGLGCLQVDACVRVDAPLAAQLRTHVGRPVFEPGNPAMSFILAASPHRIFLSRIGRVEVFQPIPPPHGTSPLGPHTHVLPKLLRHRRSHAATEPIPDHLVACGYLYPAHPAKDELGVSRPFDAARHDRFQAMLRTFGASDIVALKERVLAAVADGNAPQAIPAPHDRFARACVRVALRQMQAMNKTSPALPAWLAAYDGARTADDPDDAADPHENQT